MTSTTSGMVCSHHHLYSSLARGMPGTPVAPQSFIDILSKVWWKLDAALDEEMLYWSAALGAAEALLSGTTAIIDHHESPNFIEGSLDAIAAACDLVGVRHKLCYGVTDRWDESGQLREVSSTTPMSIAARRGLEENVRYVQTGRPALLGIHAAFTCGQETLETVSEIAEQLGIGVHIHVAEGPDDATAASRLQQFAKDNWLLIHAVHLNEFLPGTIVHNPRSNMNNSVGYAHPADKSNRIALGTDGIGADMMEEFRLSFAQHRHHDVTASPDMSWQWLENGFHLFPEAQQDQVTWSYDHMDEPWRLAYTTGLYCKSVTINNDLVVDNGRPTQFDIDEVRAKAAEQSVRLFQRLENM